MKPEPCSRQFCIGTKPLPWISLCALLFCGAGQHPLSGASFSNSTAIGIPTVGTAAPYPSAISVSGLSGEILDVTVTLLGLMHAAPADLDILLVGPNNERVVLMSDAGAMNRVSDIDLTFADGARTILPEAGTLVRGTYRPTNYALGDFFPGFPQTLFLGNSLSAFLGSNPNGSWRLYVVDDLSPGAGTIANGWRVDIVTTNYPPRIVKQPQDLTVLVGSSATFQVEVDGTPPFFYQWVHNNQIVVPFGQGTDTLVLPAVNAADAGGYFVVVTNGARTPTGAPGVASRTAELRVAGPLEVVIVPATVDAKPGETVVFRAAADGLPPLRYQWTLNGVVLPGETNVSLTIRDLQVGDAGHYAVMVWNDDEAKRSAPALLRLPIANAFPMRDKFEERLTAETAAGIAQGNSADATLQPGEAPLRGGGKSVWFQWLAPETGIVTVSSRGSAFDTQLAVYRGDNVGRLELVTMDDDSGGGHTSELTFNAAKGERFQILLDGYGVGGAGGEFTVTWALTQTTRPIPVIVKLPDSQAVPVGSDAVFRVQTESPNDLFQWYRVGDPLPLPGQNQNTLVLRNVSSRDVGLYRVAIRNGFDRLIFSPPFQLQLGVKLIEDKFESMYLTSGGPPGAGFFSIGLGNSVSNEAPAEATGGEGDPTPCGGPFFGTLWQGLMATNSGMIQVETTGSSIPARLAVYRLTGGPSDFLNPPIICDLTSAGLGLPAIGKFSATNGSNYTVVVEGLGGGNLALTCRMGLAPALTNALNYCAVPTNGTVVLQMPATNWWPVPACQWRRDGVNLPNATNASLVLTNFNAGMVGLYSVVVSNFVRSATNQVAYLTLAGPFALDYSWVGSGLQLGFKVAVSNTTPFVLQSAGAITGPWVSVATNPDPCLILFYTNSSPWLNPQRFFRAVPWSPP